jgi:hypothetical protein
MRTVVRMTVEMIHIVVTMNETVGVTIVVMKNVDVKGIGIGLEIGTKTETERELEKMIGVVRGSIGIMEEEIEIMDGKRIDMRRETEDTMKDAVLKVARTVVVETMIEIMGGTLERVDMVDVVIVVQLHSLTAIQQRI